MKIPQPPLRRLLWWLRSKWAWRKGPPLFVELLGLWYIDPSAAVERTEQALSDPNAPLSKEQRQTLRQYLVIWRAKLDGTILERPPEVDESAAYSLLLEQCSTLQQTGEYAKLVEVVLRYLLNSKIGSAEVHGALALLIDASYNLNQQDIAVCAARLMLAHHDFVEEMSRTYPAHVDPRWQTWLRWPLAPAVRMLGLGQEPEVWERILLLAIKYKHVIPHPEIKKVVYGALADYYTKTGRLEEAEAIRKQAEE